MAELVTVARPYAEAIFRAALEKNQLGPTADGLAFASTVVSDERMRSVLTDPRIATERKKDLFFEVAGDRLGALLRNLVALLLENHRDVLLPQIARLFEELKHDHDRVLRARITSARPLEESQRMDLVQALERQYGRKVEAEIDVDPGLLGGARVQVGDQVIHASVRDALAQMAAALAR
jgi:F-type H+-transporting ATPase subunit delta